ncbi:MAG: hypothetical protein ACODAD_11060 [Planctomycetota bacterium]
MRISLEGKKTLECTDSGVVFFLTPSPKRNRDSQTETLKLRDFEKLVLPEVRLFNPGVERERLRSVPETV